jgi:CRP-like cAMP-binding protein
VLDKKNLLQILKESALFKNVNEFLIKEILNTSEISKFKKKKLFSSNELREFVFIIIKGRVKNYQVNPHNGKEYTIFLFSKGEVFDIISFVKKERHNVLFETLEESYFLKISHTNLDLWRKKEFQLNQNIIELLSLMFLELEQNTTDLALYDTFTRLSKLMLKNISLLDKNISSKELTLNHLEKLSHEDLANLIGTAREVVSRHLKTLKDKNILETVEKKHHIINLQSLIDCCKLDM